jgi:hypothetical protein
LDAQSALKPSDAWARIFPAPKIPEVLGYVVRTWQWLTDTYPAQITFQHDEPTLTNNLCEALQDQDRRFEECMDCNFIAEVWQLRRQASGKVEEPARVDIQVILGAPGVPHLVLEFKKLNGSGKAHGQYCFDGLNRFLDGKYARKHSHGVMCAFTLGKVTDEAAALSKYLCKHDYPSRLGCRRNTAGGYITEPSEVAPGLALFDTCHDRPTCWGEPITMLHLMLPCPSLS